MIKTQFDPDMILLFTANKGKKIVFSNNGININGINSIKPDILNIFLFLTINNWTISIGIENTPNILVWIDIPTNIDEIIKFINDL